MTYHPTIIAEKDSLETLFNSMVPEKSPLFLKYRPQMRELLECPLSSSVLIAWAAHRSDHGWRPDGYIWKTHKELTVDTGLTREQQRYGLRWIKENLPTILDVKVKRARGTPTNHFKLNMPELERVLLEKAAAQQEPVDTIPQNEDVKPVMVNAIVPVVEPNCHAVVTIAEGQEKASAIPIGANSPVITESTLIPSSFLETEKTEKYYKAPGISETDITTLQPFQGHRWSEDLYCLKLKEGKTSVSASFGVAEGLAYAARTDFPLLQKCIAYRYRPEERRKIHNGWKNIAARVLGGWQWCRDANESRAPAPISIACPQWDMTHEELMKYQASQRREGGRLIH